MQLQTWNVGTNHSILKGCQYYLIRGKHCLSINMSSSVIISACIQNRFLATNEEGLASFEIIKYLFKNDSTYFGSWMNLTHLWFRFFTVSKKSHERKIPTWCVKFANCRVSAVINMVKLCLASFWNRSTTVNPLLPAIFCFRKVIVWSKVFEKGWIRSSRKKVKFNDWTFKLALNMSEMWIGKSFIFFSFLLRDSYGANSQISKLFSSKMGGAQREEKIQVPAIAKHFDMCLLFTLAQVSVISESFSDPFA